MSYEHWSLIIAPLEESLSRSRGGGTCKSISLHVEAERERHVLRDRKTRTRNVLYKVEGDIETEREREIQNNLTLIGPIVRRSWSQANNNIK